MLIKAKIPTETQYGKNYKSNPDNTKTVKSDEFQANLNPGTGADNDDTDATLGGLSSVSSSP